MGNRTGSVALLLTVALAALTTAQPPDRWHDPARWRGMTEGMAFLVGIPEIQEELGLNDQQKRLLDALLEDLRDQRRGLFGGRGGRPPGLPEGPERDTERRQRFEQFSQQSEALVETILEPDQAKQLDQIQRQWEGSRALDRDDVAKTLGLSEDQRAKIREIRAGIVRPEPGTQRDAAAADDPPRSREQVEAEVLALLSDAQCTAWDTMKGKPFPLPERLRPFGQRGPRGRGPGNREPAPPAP